MRLVGTVGAAILISLLGTTLPAYSQRGVEAGKPGKHENQDRGNHEADQKHSGKPSHEPERAGEQHRPQRVEHVQQAPRRVEPRREPAIRRVHEAPRHVEPRQQRVVWQQHRAREWAHEHQSWQQRGGYHGYRVPHDRYIVYFGREHRFRIHALPVIIVAGHPRFHYHGYWVTVVDPWPEYWAANWYETDDVYVEYVRDGYYLSNVSRPGVSIAVNVSF